MKKKSEKKSEKPKEPRSEAEEVPASVKRNPPGKQFTKRGIEVTK